MADRQPTLSVVVPAFNEARSIGRCLDMLLAQSNPIDEIIVVDNNSTDETFAIASEYSRDNANVQVLIEPRQGVQHTRDLGVGTATGELVARIDADTYAEPRWAANIVDFFAVAPDDIAGGYGMSTMHDMPLQRPFTAIQARMTRRVGKALAEGQVTVVGEAIGANCVMRKEVWREVAGKTSHRDDIMEDADLSLTIRDAGWRIALIPGMDAQTSGRRLYSSPRSYWKYTAYSPRTYAMHGRRRAMVMASVGIQFARLAQIGVWIPLLWWDPTAKRFGLVPRGLRRTDRELPSGHRADSLPEN
ncbi:glycosyltransferase [Williamsia phyllosphaerae]|uniref:4,4'-diaponeurosporenoate glycosyltransferase n=1 Tax=Williamsia phyllosphaerae TaxID=885042 RepID=A0ABQ1US43_9NOCA|nr:glycosyltransferase family 2 protein [Williamsia phyllosphaerae]GGF24582.1 hypothetical protein GCM10007298_20620 [Williamsia phyllosphaerae]